MPSQSGGGAAPVELPKKQLVFRPRGPQYPNYLLGLWRSAVPRGKRTHGQQGIGSSKSNRHRPPWPIQKTSKKTMKMKIWKETGNEEECRTVEVWLRLNRARIVGESARCAEERRRTWAKASN